MKKTLDQYNQETLNRAIENNNKIEFTTHKNDNGRILWYSVEIYDNKKLISGYGDGIMTDAIRKAKEYLLSKNLT